jgi:pilus assembly protein Flp/PilA
MIARLIRDHAGASAAEYTLILAILGAGIAIAAVGLGNVISGSINSASAKIESCGGQC